MRILGIDPGTKLTGYGIVDAQGVGIQAITHGALKLVSSSGKVPLEQRLFSLYQGLDGLIKRFHPRCMVVERVFYSKNVLSALKLGHARGVVLMLAAKYGLSLVELTPAEVKLMIAGNGGATKEQVAKMVQVLVGRQEFETDDASDATALAICHSMLLHSKIGKSVSGKPSKGGSIAEALGF